MFGAREAGAIKFIRVLLAAGNVEVSGVCFKSRESVFKKFKN